MLLRSLVIAGVVAGISQGTSEALADPLPAATFSAEADLWYYGTFTQNGLSGFPGTVRTLESAAGLTLGADPNVGTSSVNDDYENNHSAASAGLTYYFEVLGPADSTVPVFIQGQVYAMSVGPVWNPTGDLPPPDNATAMLEVGIGGTPNIINQWACAFRNPEAVDIPACNPALGAIVAFGGTASINVSADYDIPANTPIFVTESVTSESTYGQENAYVQEPDLYGHPMIYIDPGFANANDYSLIFSDGVGPGSPATAPEPGAAALFASGLFGLTRMRIRRN